MRVVVARPPMFAEIDAAFHIAGQRVIFAWGDTIYNPMGVDITPELQAHESVHRDRQGSAPELWWKIYIADPQFRLNEELPAHEAEYREFCRNNRNGTRRNARRLYLHQLASRLASPLYGRLITYEAARKRIKAAA